MAEWWNGLGLVKQVFYLIAAPATALLALQSVMAVLGLGGDVEGGLEEPMELELGEEPVEGGEAFSGDFKFFTIRGLIAFFAVFGWSGAAMADRLSLGVAVLLAFLAGFAAMVLIGWLFFSMTKLQSSGNIVYSNCIGKNAEVYLTIPPEGKGKGKVMLTVQERFIEAAAITREAEGFRSGETVRVAGVMSDHTLVVVKGENE